MDINLLQKESEMPKDIHKLVRLQNRIGFISKYFVFPDQCSSNVFCVIIYSNICTTVTILRYQIQLSVF